MTTTRVIQRTVALDQGRQLGQVRPADTNAAAIYTLSEAIQTETDELEIANTSTSVIEYEVFHDTTGSTSTPGKCIAIGEVAARRSERLEITAYLIDEGETISVKTSVADSATFTLYGRETQERAR